MFRRFLWYLAGVGAIFIAGLIAAPTIQDGIDSLLGRAGDAGPVSVTTLMPQDDEIADAPVTADTPAEEAEEAESAPDPEEIPEAVPAETETESDPDAALLAARLDAIEARLALLEAAEAASAQAGQAALDPETGKKIAAMEARLALVESMERPRFTGNGADGLLLALARISQRVDGGQTFAGEMLEFHTLFDASPAAARTENEASVSVLGKFADAGVRNAATLRRSFATLLPAALEAAALPADAGWWDKIWAGLKSVVVVRRTGQVEGEEAKAVLARAEFHLGVGDIAAALAEVQGMDPRVAEVLAEWQAEASASLAARQAVEALIASYSASRGDVTPAPTPSEGG